MEAKGAGARLAWLRESSAVEQRLAALVSPSMLERLSFDDGCEASRALLAAYASARALDRVLSHAFDSGSVMQKAVGLALNALSACDTVTLVMQQADLRGVYRLPWQAFACTALDLLRIDGDSLLVGVDHHLHGLLLDREVDASGRESLTLEIWNSAQ